MNHYNLIGKGEQPGEHQHHKLLMDILDIEDKPYSKPKLFIMPSGHKVYRPYRRLKGEHEIPGWFATEFARFNSPTGLAEESTQANHIFRLSMFGIEFTQIYSLWTLTLDARPSLKLARRRKLQQIGNIKYVKPQSAGNTRRRRNHRYMTPKLYQMILAKGKYYMPEIYAATCIKHGKVSTIYQGKCSICDKKWKERSLPVTYFYSMGLRIHSAYPRIWLGKNKLDRTCLTDNQPIDCYDQSVSVPEGDLVRFVMKWHGDKGE